MNEHSLDSDLALMHTEIMAATRPQDVFGSPAKQLPLAQQEVALRQRFQQLQHIVNPDQYTRVVDANAAADARDTLLRLYEQAKGLLKHGTTTVQFTIRDTQYHVGERVARGENSVMHRAIATTHSTAEEVVLKIATDAEASLILKKESEYLRLFQALPDQNPVARVRRTLPKIIDSFDVDGRQVTVLPYWYGYKSVREIVENFDQQLPAGQAAWIARRVLALPLTAALAGLQHNAITPEHVLVHPITHEPIYLGWGHASPTKKAISVADMHMTGNTLWYLFGNPETQTWNADVPQPIADLIETLSVDGVPDLAQFFTDFTQMIYKHLGKKYRPLTIS